MIFVQNAKKKLSIDPDDACKDAFNSHTEFVKEYKKTKADILKKCEEDDTTLVFEFDYGQNLMCPKLSANSHYYKQKLTMNVFNVHCHNDNNSAFYWFCEHTSGKTSDTVASFLHDFLKLYLPSSKVKKIILLSDSSGAQNKNQHIVKFCSWLSKLYKVQIEHIFPVRGHSYNQCDRNFGLYGAWKKKTENIETPLDYVKMMKSCRQNPQPFLVIDGTDLIKDSSSAFNEHAFQKPYKPSQNFLIQSYDKLEYNPDGYIKITYIDDHSVQEIFSVWKDNFDVRSVLKNIKNIVPVGLNASKVKDLKSFFEFISIDAQRWYENVLANLKDTTEKQPKNKKK